MSVKNLVLSWFDRLASIKSSDPELTPDTWCQVQPCLKINVASKEIVLTQPFSTFLVSVLGLLTTGCGFYFLYIQNGELSRFWWGISLILWGVGALLAGTSYQAFGYQIKCSGRQICTWTSWWEVIYIIFQQLSMAVMLVAVAYSCTVGLLRLVLIWYAIVSGLVYVICTIGGGIVPVKSLITFNWMVRFSTPILLIFFLLNGYRYYIFRDPMDLVFLGTWISLVLISVIYCIYDDLGITERLWAQGEGIWFSQNDVLHVGLIGWVIYIGLVVTHSVKDYTAPFILD